MGNARKFRHCRRAFARSCKGVLAAYSILVFHISPPSLPPSLPPLCCFRASRHNRPSPFCCCCCWLGVAFLVCRLWWQANQAAKTDTENSSVDGNSVADSSVTSASNPAEKPAGGPKGFVDNHMWCQNPQYLIRLKPDTKDKVCIKIVLKRRDRPKVDAKGKEIPRGPNQKCGIVITKGVPNEDAILKRPKPGAERTNHFGEPVKTKESSLKTGKAGGTGTQPGATAKPEEAQEEPIRKLQVSTNEFCQQSDYSSDKEATTLLVNITQEWAANGILVVPSLSAHGEQGSYRLEVHSDHELDVKVSNPKPYNPNPEPNPNPNPNP
jgi:hypothetical protein